MASSSEFSMLIDGDLVKGEAKLGVINPATGEVFAECPKATEADLDRAVAAALRAFKAWKDVPVKERRDALRQAGDIISAHADELATLFTMEQGRPIALAK